MRIAIVILSAAALAACAPRGLSSCDHVVTERQSITRNVQGIVSTSERSDTQCIRGGE